MQRLFRKIVFLLFFTLVSVCLWQSALTQSSGSTNHTDPEIALGERLFFEKRLSVDNTVSCATCHDPATAFASKDSVAIGVKNRTGTRNVPTLLNVRFNESYFWDGRSPSLEEQAKHPLLNPVEMGMITETAIVNRLSSIPEYRKHFSRVFGREGISLGTIVKAIAAYERTLVSQNSPFDRFIAGNVKAITENQVKGWELFKGKGGCIECHTFAPTAPFFTDFKFYNTGVASGDRDFAVLRKRVDELKSRSRSETLSSSFLAHEVESSKLGRFLVTNAEKDIGAFKTPTLRDVELTGPYMHDGSLRTLLDVIRFYNQGGQKNPNLDSRIRSLNLTETEMNELVEFLRTLTSDDVLRRAQTSQPQTRMAYSSKP